MWTARVAGRKKLAQLAEVTASMVAATGVRDRGGLISIDFVGKHGARFHSYDLDGEKRIVYAV